MLDQESLRKYLIYAIGEILLVVIGILIALQVNNWNVQVNKRNQELHYLENIKKDLLLNIAQMDEYIEDRTKKVQSASIVLEHFEGKPITDPNEFNAHLQNIYTWQRFFQVNNTFQELTYSGNLALISNDSIKNTLLTLETLYQVLKAEEGHFRFDSETALFEPGYRTQDINRFIKSHIYYISDGKEGEDVKITPDEFNVILKDLKQKNGFVMAFFEFSVMNEQMDEMKKMSKSLIELIDKELK